MGAPLSGAHPSIHYVVKGSLAECQVVDADERLPASYQEVSRTLTVEQKRVLLWRLQTGGENRDEAAEIAGVSVRQLYRWLSSPEFRRLWDDPDAWWRKAVRTEKQTTELASYMVLNEVMQDREVSAGTRVDAASKGLTAVQRAREHEEPAGGAGVAELLKGWILEGQARLVEGESDGTE